MESRGVFLGAIPWPRAQDAEIDGPRLLLPRVQPSGHEPTAPLTPQVPPRRVATSQAACPAADPAAEENEVPDFEATSPEQAAEEMEAEATGPVKAEEVKTEDEEVKEEPASLEQAAEEVEAEATGHEQAEEVAAEATGRGGGGYVPVSLSDDSMSESESDYGAPYNDALRVRVATQELRVRLEAQEARLRAQEAEATGHQRALAVEEEPEEDDEGDPRVSNNFFPDLILRAVFFVVSLRFAFRHGASHAPWRTVCAGISGSSIGCL